LYTNNRSHRAANWWGPPMLLLHLPFTRAAVAQSNHHLARKCSSLICRTILVVFWAWRECSNAFWACNGRQCLASLVTGAGPSICKASACSTRQSPTSFSPPADASLRSSQVETAEYPAPRPGGKLILGRRVHVTRCCSDRSGSRCSQSEWQLHACRFRSAHSAFGLNGLRALYLTLNYGASSHDIDR
jgi:hypothetical protein